MTMRYRCALARRPGTMPVIPSAASSLAAAAPAASSLLNVGQTLHEALPLSEEFDWLNDLCGPIVQGGVYLCAGPPGSNKSTLARQWGLDLARQGHSVLFILTEEPADRLKAAVLRMASEWPTHHVRKALGNLFVETNLHDLETLPGFFAQHVLNPMGAYHGVKLIVLDSVQGSGLQASAARQWRGLYQFAALTRAARITTFLVAHVTKKNEIAGPRSTEHNIDAALVLRKAGRRRHLGVPKNRFGREVHRFLPLDLDEQTVTLKVSPYVESFTAVARGYRPGLGVAEVQGAVTLPRWGAAARVMAPNLPRREIEQLIVCIGQIAGLELDELDFSVQCRLPGERRYSGVLGLPLCLSLVSSFLQKPIPTHQIHVGEVDLCRNIRELPPVMLEDLAMAIAEQRVPLPVRLLVPTADAPHFPGGGGVEVVPCRRLDDALYVTWPDLR